MNQGNQHASALNPGKSAHAWPPKETEIANLTDETKINLDKTLSIDTSNFLFFFSIITTNVKKIFKS
jgi:hypothetical protein